MLHLSLPLQFAAIVPGLFHSSLAAGPGSWAGARRARGSKAMEMRQAVSPFGFFSVTAS